MINSLQETQDLQIDLKIPNEETQEAMLDVLLKRNMNKPISLQEFKDKYFAKEG